MSIVSMEWFPITTVDVASSVIARGHWKALEATLKVIGVIYSWRAEVVFSRRLKLVKEPPASQQYVLQKLPLLRQAAVLRHKLLQDQATAPNRPHSALIHLNALDQISA
jgi:hypothetical protein